MKKRDWPSLALRGLLALSLCLSVCTAGWAAQKLPGLLSGGWRAELLAKSPRLQPAFQFLCERLRRTLPSDARLLLEPARLEPSGMSHQTRWHLMFNFELAPIRCYTAEPAAASGTLVDWPRWIEHHFPGSTRLGSGKAPTHAPASVQAASAERHIEWKLTYPQTGALALAQVALYHRVGQTWKPVELAPVAAQELERPSAWSSLGTAALCALALWLAGRLLLGGSGGVPLGSGLALQADALALGLVLGPAMVLWACWMQSGPLSIAQGRVMLAGLAALGLWRLWSDRRRPGDAASPPPGDPWTWPQRLLLGCALAFALFGALLAAGLPQQRFDSTMHFAYKGRLLLNEGLGSDGWTDLTAPVGRIVTHPGYPPGLGALTALASCIPGRFEPDAGKCLMPLYLWLGAWWLWRALRPRSRSAGLVAALSWLSLPIFYYGWTEAGRQVGGSSLGLLLGPEGALNLAGVKGFKLPAASDLLDGTGDLPLAAMLLGAALALSRLLGLCRASAEAGGKPEPRDSLLAGVLCGGLLLLKNEGLALAALLVSLAVLLAAPSLWSQRGKARGRLAALAWTLGIAALCSLPWLVVRGRIPVIDENYSKLLTLANIERDLGRAARVWSGFWTNFSSLPSWNLVWACFAAALLVLTVRLRGIDREAWLCALVALSGMAVYFLILLVTPWDLPLLFSTFIPDRLLVHVAGLGLWCAAAVAWPEHSEQRA